VAEHLMDASIYDLSPIEKYAEALGAELQTRGSLFHAVFVTKPPQQFIDLWRSDVFRWLDSLAAKPNGQQAEDAVAALKLYS